METQKLEQSASVVPGSLWRRCGLPILMIVVAGSLFANVMQCGEHRMTRYAANVYYDGMMEARKERKALEGQARKLVEDARSMNAADILSGPHDRAAHDVFTACLKDPSGLSFRWWGLNHIDALPYSFPFQLHNAAPVTNAFGKSFGFGDACDTGPTALVRIAEAHGDDYLLMVEERDAEFVSAVNGCPAGAYRFARRDNEIMDKAVSQACLARAKATEFKSIPAGR